MDAYKYICSCSPAFKQAFLAIIMATARMPAVRFGLLVLMHSAFVLVAALLLFFYQSEYLNMPLLS